MTTSGASNQKQPVDSPAGGNRQSSISPSALEFSFIRASGPGGQNVNKRSTKCQLRVFIDQLGLPEAQAARLRTLAGARLISDNELIITCDENRSQVRNKEECLERLEHLLKLARRRPKKRIATKPTKGSKERRLESKRKQSDRKRKRRPDFD